MVIFVVVIVALVVLNAFFVLIIRTLSARVGKFAQNNMLRQSSVFDELIMKKEDAYKNLIGRITEAEERLRTLSDDELSPAPRQGAADYFATPPANYSDPDFADEYREIREHFVFDKKSKLEDLMREIPADPEDEATFAARRILDEVDADTLYQLATLPSDEQYAILDEVFDEDQRALLHEYAEGIEEFVGYDFLDWLRRYVFEHSSTVIVRTAGDDGARLDGVAGRISVERDDALCEGMYVISHGKMYDYSVRSKEISG
jgi:hypothetical protein